MSIDFVKNELKAAYPQRSSFYSSTTNDQGRDSYNIKLNAQIIVEIPFYGINTTALIPMSNDNNDVILIPTSEVQ